MQVRKLAVTGVVAVASWTAIGVATPAFALCESYSGGCPSTPPTGGGGIGGVDEQPATGNDEQPAGGADEQPASGNDEQPAGGGTGEGAAGNDSSPVQGGASDAGAGTVTRTDTPTTLPFTGGELVLLTTIGVGALAGGTALVVAGRRRNATA